MARRIAFALLALTAVSMFGLWWFAAVHGTLPVSSAGGGTERVSLGDDESQALGDSFGRPSISSDGRYVAFASRAANLVVDDTNPLWDVFVRDRQAGTTERISVNSLGEQAVGGNSDRPSISADGRTVAFRSGATNLVSGDTNGLADIFVRNLESDTTERVSVDSFGGQAMGGNSDKPSASADGQFVAFSSAATNLVTVDSNGMEDVFVRSLGTATTERVNVSSAESEADSGGGSPSISADGRYVAFDSGATNLVLGDTDFHTDIFVRDRQVTATERVSVDDAEVQADGENYDPAISADGRYVTFESYATNLVSDDTNGFADIFVHDRIGGTTERASVDDGEAQSDGDSYASSISADGRYVAFEFWGANLVPGGGDTNGAADIFVRDREAGFTHRESVDSSGTEAVGGYSSGSSISADGRFVAFASTATNLVVDDTNAKWDVFVRDRCVDTSCAGILVSLAKTGPQAIAGNIGTALPYSITVTNSSSGSPAELSITDNIPDSLNFVSATWSRTDPSGSGSCGVIGRDVTCDISALAPGAVANVTLSTTLRYPPTGGSVSNMACWSAVGATPGPNRCDTTVTGVGSSLIPQDLRLVPLTLPTSADGTGGTTVSYVLIAQNMGPGAVDGARMTFKFPRFVSAHSAAWSIPNGGSGSCTTTADRTTCDIGTLEELSAAAVQLNVRLDRAYTGNRSFQALLTPTDESYQNNVLNWTTNFTGPHRKIVFVDGINSDHGCEPETRFPDRVDWIHDYLVSNQRVADKVWLDPWNTPGGGSFEYFSYGGLGAYCADGKSPNYESDATCAGIQSAANKLRDFLEDRRGGQDVTFDIIAHSMGGVVVSKWIADHPEQALEWIHSVVTFDSPLQGAPWINLMGLGIKGKVPWADLVDDCNPFSASIQNMIWEDGAPRPALYRSVMQAGNFVSYYTIDATENEALRVPIPVLGWDWDTPSAVDAVPERRTQMDHEVAHVRADMQHHQIFYWDDPHEESEDRTRVLHCIGNAVVGESSCTPLYKFETLSDGGATTSPFKVEPEDVTLDVMASTSSGGVSLSLQSPSGALIDASISDPLVVRVAGDDYETYTIGQPEAGIWNLTVTATSVAPGGAGVILTADTRTLLPPDEDGDGSPDGEDNCPGTVGDQRDSDADGQGDACDLDDDDDSISDALDNCPTASNPDQGDIDDDGTGDACDSDNDNDYMPDNWEESHACLNATVPDGTEDPDGDYLPSVNELLIGTAPCLADTDSDALSDPVELACGAIPFDTLSLPERVDPPHGGVDEDGDGLIDEGLPDVAVDYDCDGDGAIGSVESTQLTNPQHPDTDTDGVGDSADNCPNWSNTPQNLPTWAIPATDTDCDGFTVAQEQYMGTNPTKHCPNTATVNDEPVDAWPSDFNDSQFTSLADVVLMGPVYNLPTGSDPAKKRFDLNASGNVSLADVVLMGPFYNKGCE